MGREQGLRFGGGEGARFDGGEVGWFGRHDDRIREILWRVAGSSGQIREVLKLKMSGG